MEFEFSKDEKLWRKAVRDFVQRELAPQDPTTWDYIPRSILKNMGELGFFSLTIPEEYGGNPATWVMTGILAEELARVTISLSYFTMISYETALVVAAYGTDEAKRNWLPELVSGNKISCIAVTESDSGSNFGSIKTTANRNEDFYHISGEKVPVSFGMEADVALCFVRTGNTELGGITALLIPLDLPGIRKSPWSGTGLSLSAPALLCLDGVRVPVKYGIGKEGTGLDVHRSMGFGSEFSQIMSALISLGAAQKGLESAVMYSKERHAFGKPIAKFEGISEKIAEDATLIEAARWLCYRALFLKDRGSPHAKEAAMCGWWCPKVAYATLRDTLLIHGHEGYSNDHPFQQMWRDIVAFEMISGTEQMLKLRISRKLIGATGVPDPLSDSIS